MTADERLFDSVLRQALDVLRLGASQRAATMRRLQRLERALARELAAGDLSKARREEIEAFLAGADEIIRQHYADIQEDLQLEDLSRTFAERTAGAIEVALGVEAAKMPKSDYFRSLASDVLIQGAPSAEWWSRQAEKTRFQFAAAVRQGLTNNETNQQIIRRIVGNEEMPGVMQIARRDAASLVQTSVQTVANDARRATFQANDDVIKGLRQVSTLDGHTSLTCVSYSGAEWNLEYEPINGNTLPFNGGCPRHFNCRSVEVPITKTFRELGVDIDEAPVSTRASSAGQIDANTTFRDFLQRQGPAYQDKVLGEGRAQLWRDGKITLRDLVNGEGNPVTLATLREVASERFNPAHYARRFDDPSVNADTILDRFPDDTRQRIADVEKRLKKETQTHLLHRDAEGRYSLERRALHREILYEGRYGPDPDNPGERKWYPGLLDPAAARRARVAEGETPTFTLLGGRGGSGKSAFSGKDYPDAQVYDKDRVLLFDADVIKHMLPEYRGFNAATVHEESSDILKAVLQIARQSRVNVVLDGTLKSGGSARRLVDTFRNSGYRVEGHYMFLPRQEAAFRAVHRFLGKTGRYVPVEIVLDNIDNEQNFWELLEFFDVWSFRDNNVARNTPPRLIAQGRGR